MKFSPKAVNSESRLMKFQKQKLIVAKKSIHVQKFISESIISSKVNACEMQNLQKYVEIHGNFHVLPSTLEISRYPGAMKHMVRYMEISMYLAMKHMVRYMEISMYLGMKHTVRYMEISMYLAMKHMVRYMEISMYIGNVHGNFHVPYHMFHRKVHENPCTLKGNIW